MSQNSAAYDLGNLDRANSDSSPLTEASPRPDSPAGTREVRRRSRASFATARPGTGRNLGESLSILIPGSGQLIRGDVSVGLFFLASFGFVATLAWALTGSVDRMAATLSLLGYPPAATAWVLCGLFATAAVLHLGCVLNAGAALEPARKPVLAGIASFLVPGWGQLLNGDRLRAVLFLGLLWLVGAGWVLVSPVAERLLADLHLYLPPWASILASPAVRWTLPAIVWTLSVYDAVSRAAGWRGVRP